MAVKVMVKWTNGKNRRTNASIVLESGKKIVILKKEKLEDFFKKVNDFKEETKKNEACLVMLCLKIGKRIKLEPNEEIKLFYDSEQFCCNQPEITITNNQELYSLLKNLVQS